MFYQFDDYVLKVTSRELWCRGELVPIEPQVFDLLVYLIRNHERVVSRDDLLAAVWGGRIVSESAIDSRIAAARSAIGDSGKEQRLIKTFPRKGVRFVGTVRQETNAIGSRAEPDQGAPAIPLPDRPSVAILSFTNMSSDPEQDYFADGIAEEIITALSRCSGLFVISRNSSFSFKGRSMDVRQIGRELGVRYVLEGSVRRAGDRLRITGQLTDAGSGASIWADRFEGQRSDVFELQDHITESVVAAIEPKLQLAEFERSKQRAAANLDAYDLVLHAQQLEYEFTEGSLARAIALSKQALTLDPNYATAMALCAYCYAERRFQGWHKDREAEGEEGLRFALRAIELGKDNANVLWMCAYAIRELGADSQRSRELVNRSLHLNPNSAIALTVGAWNEIVLGNPDRALELLGRAERLSPRDPRGWFMAAARSLAYLARDQFEEAVAAAKKALAQNPRSAQAWRFLAVGLARQGDLQGAAHAVNEGLQIQPTLSISNLRAWLRFMPEELWEKLSGGLRLAGLRE
jgi:TolB-like protein/Flp pilus assembly protein TadD